MKEKDKQYELFNKDIYKMLYIFKKVIKTHKQYKLYNKDIYKILEEHRHRWKIDDWQAWSGPMKR